MRRYCFPMNSHYTCFGVDNVNECDIWVTAKSLRQAVSLIKRRIGIVYGARPSSVDLWPDDLLSRPA